MNPLAWVIGTRTIGEWLKWVAVGMLAILPVIGYFIGRSAGVNKERTASQQRILKSIEEARNVEDRVRRMDGAALDDELRHWTRD